MWELENSYKVRQKFNCMHSYSAYICVSISQKSCISLVIVLVTPIVVNVEKIFIFSYFILSDVSFVMA